MRERTLTSTLGSPDPVIHLNLFIRDGIFISNLSYTLDHEIQVVSFNIYWMLQIHHRKI